MPSVQELRTELRRTVVDLSNVIRQRGLVTAAGRVAAVVGGQLAFPLLRARRRDERFDFRGDRLPYTVARYNNSFLNERVAEISIAKWFLSGDNGRVLEVGNVLSHYGVTGHTVLDKYEVIPGVLNMDVVDYVPEKPFDTVVAISTLEHVGWDESPREPEKVFRAIENVKNCAAPGGRVLITVPIGQNESLDAGLRSGEVKFAQETWLMRTNRRNEWVEADRDEVLSKKSGEPYTGANGIYVGMIAD